MILSNCCRHKYQTAPNSTKQYQTVPNRTVPGKQSQSVKSPFPVSNPAPEYLRRKSRRPCGIPSAWSVSSLWHVRTPPPRTFSTCRWRCAGTRSPRARRTAGSRGAANGSVRDGERCERACCWQPRPLSKAKK